MRRQQPKPGQNGKYWLSKKPGREGIEDAWCRTWYDAATRQTRRVSLGTADVHEASRRLAEWVSLNERPQQGRRDQVLIEQALMFYWEDRANKLPSARTMKHHLSLWQQWWSGRTVDEITSHEQKRFRQSLGEGRLKPSTIDKITATGRSALIHAVKHGILESAPHIFSIETPEEKEARPPLGRPLSIEEMAAFIDAINQPHLMVFALILANTLTRPIAALELRRDQYDKATNIVDLNPKGRIQTNKRRPILPVTPTLRPWLETPISSSDVYVAYNGAAISALVGSWKMTAKRAGLEGSVTPYSFRHGMAELLGDRGVHLDDIGAFLGHSRQGAQKTTEIYVRRKAIRLRPVADAIEGIMEEVRKLLRRVPIDNPRTYLEWVRNQPRPHNGRLTPQRRAEMLDMIRAGRPVSEIARSFGVTKAAVAKRRKKLARKHVAPPACRQRAVTDQP